MAADKPCPLLQNSLDVLSNSSNHDLCAVLLLFGRKISRRSDFLCSVVRSYDGETERKKLNGVGFRIQAELLASNEKETDSSEGKQ